MARLFEVAAQVATPLGLAGVVMIGLFVVYWQLIKGPLAAQLSGSHSVHVIKRIVTFVFILGLVAIILSIAAPLLQALLAPTGKEPAPVGFLSPGNAPTPANLCHPLEPGAFVLLAGSTGFVVSRDNSPVTIIQLGGQPTVWMDYEDQGVYVSADLVREDGRMVATLRRNQFEINTNNYYELQQPTRHELTVKDKSGTVVLNIVFLNEQAFRIEGHFVRPGYGKLTITRDAITIQNPHPRPFGMRNVCFRGAPIAIKA
jgi:hypothetical protein